MRIANVHDFCMVWMGLNFTFIEAHTEIDYGNKLHSRDDITMSFAPKSAQMKVFHYLQAGKH